MRRKKRERGQTKIFFADCHNVLKQREKEREREREREREIEKGFELKLKFILRGRPSRKIRKVSRKRWSAERQIQIDKRMKEDFDVVA